MIHLTDLFSQIGEKGKRFSEADGSILHTLDPVEHAEAAAH